MRILFTILLFMTSCFVQAQDTIVYVAGDRAAVEVVQITPSQIRFKEDCRHKDGIYAIPKRRVQRLYYQGEWHTFGRQQHQPRTRTIRPLTGKADAMTCKHKVKWNNAWGNTGIMLSHITIKGTRESYVTSMLYESIGFDHIHILSPRVPIYLKTGIGLRYADGNYLATAIPTCFGFNFEHPRVSVMPCIGYVFTINHLPKLTEKLSLSWNMGIDINFSFHLYLGAYYSVELIPIQYADKITERLHAFEIRVGGCF